MKVELLHIADCPNAEGARALLKDTLHELGRREEISEVQVSDAAQAQALKFPGSPTIRVDDMDVETPLPEQPCYGLCCRMYLIEGRLHGFPTREMVRKAILALSPAETEAKER